MDCESILLTLHAFLRIRERKISSRVVHRIVREGEVIKEYPNDEPHPCFIVLGHAGQRPLHVVVARDEIAKRCIVITVYDPDPSLWEPDLKTRKRR